MLWGWAATTARTVTGSRSARPLGQPGADPSARAAPGAEEHQQVCGRAALLRQQHQPAVLGEHLGARGGHGARSRAASASGAASRGPGIRHRCAVGDERGDGGGQRGRGDPRQGRAVDHTTDHPHAAEARHDAEHRRQHEKGVAPHRHPRHAGVTERAEAAAVDGLRAAHGPHDQHQVGDEEEQHQHGHDDQGGAGGEQQPQAEGHLDPRHEASHERRVQPAPAPRAR